MKAYKSFNKKNNNLKITEKLSKEIFFFAYVPRVKFGKSK